MAVPLPQFSSSDPRHDDLLNDLFVRHGRATFSDTSLRKATAPNPLGGTGTIWRDWEVDMLVWHDHGPANYPLDNRPGFFEAVTNQIPSDRFGYVFSAGEEPTPTTAGGGVYFGMGWPFPAYTQSLGQTVGWEFNGSSTQSWSITNGTSLGVSGGEWRASTTLVDPALTSPSFTVDSFQAPFVHLAIQYDAIDAEAAPEDLRIQLFWETTEEPFFSEDKSVHSDTFPVRPLPAVSTSTLPRLWFPMHLHPKWDGKTIQRIRIDPISNTASPPVARPATWRLDFVRLDYDTRHAVNNPVYVRAQARKFFWDNNRDFLAQQLSRMRAATQFMLTHMRGDELGQLDGSWFVGHNGLGRPNINTPLPGNGIGTNYWDILGSGPRDLSASIMYYKALETMANLEDFVATDFGLIQPKPSVTGPDNASTIQYAETGGSLRARLEATRQAIHEEFWNPATGRYGGWRRENGELVDYGFAHFNLEALEAGIPDQEHAESVLSWLDGERIVAGDTSTGADIYTWRFAARATTRDNDLDYVWPWDGSAFPFGDQVQDGGAAIWTTYYDIGARLRYNDVEGAWTVWNRMLDHHEDVRDFGGLGADFYRAYYAANPGTLQGGGTAGGLGLDEEFVESMLAPAAWVVQWLGVDAYRPGRLRIAPRKPAALEFMAASNITYRGNVINVRHEEGVIDLAGSTISAPAAGQLELNFHGEYPEGTTVLRDGSPAPGTVTLAADRLTLVTPLSAGRYQIKPPTTGWMMRAN